MLTKFQYSDEIREETSKNGIKIVTVCAPTDFSVAQTFDCGQCFRFDPTPDGDGTSDVCGVTFGHSVRIRQSGDTVTIYGADADDYFNIWRSYLGFDIDYSLLSADILAHFPTGSIMTEAAEYGKGIRILAQDPFETLISFIISQNNNIPRIRKIIKKISIEYGVNICLQKNIKKCPLSKIDGSPCEEKCRSCGVCYTFPTADAVNKNPEKLLSSSPGFRYKYLCDAADKVTRGEVNLKMIAAARSYEHTKSCLTEIKGVGDKVASCTALFGFGNLEAFPIDVWMKRAIDEYFDGTLDPATLGKYAGVAQQYIFHYIRNLQKKQ